MKFLIAFTVLVAYASATSLLDNAEWQAYKLEHNKVYKNGIEELYRQKIWSSNAKYVQAHNEQAANGVHSFTLKMNKFGDMTNQEFVAFFNGYNKTQTMTHKPSNKVFTKSVHATIPDEVDWRKSGYVTPIKNQEQCGSCWAFSTVAGLEGQHFKATGKLVSLSEQNLVDCSQAQGNQGCNGGLMDQGFEYIKSNGGIDTEDSYPYAGVDQSCKFDASNVGATLTSYVDVKSKDEEALTQAIATIGPISVAIDASHLAFQLYHSGVYNQVFCSETRLDHGVTAVGYGKDGDKPFFLVKNSWGTGWGMDGYIQMTRNGKNQCGIATQASYPVV
jgi:cathepsin L